MFKFVTLSLFLISSTAFSSTDQNEDKQSSGYNLELCKLLEAAMPVSLKLQQSAEFRYERDRQKLERQVRRMSSYAAIRLNGDKHTKAYLDLAKAEDLASNLESPEAVLEGIEEQKAFLLQKINKEDANKTDAASRIAQFFMYEGSPIEQTNFDLYHFDIQYKGVEAEYGNQEDANITHSMPYIVEVSYRSKTNPDHFIDISFDLSNAKLLSYEQTNGEITPMENVESVLKAKEIACEEPVKKKELDKLGRTGDEDKRDGSGLAAKYIENNLVRVDGNFTIGAE